MQPTQDFAILAPVPQEHLVSGMPIAQEKGFVAFGSRKWELFRKIDEMRGDKPVPVLIYASHEDDNPRAFLPASAGAAGTSARRKAATGDIRSGWNTVRRPPRNTNPTTGAIGPCSGTFATCSNCRRTSRCRSRPFRRSRADGERMRRRAARNLWQRHRPSNFRYVLGTNRRGASLPIPQFVTFP